MIWYNPFTWFKKEEDKNKRKIGELSLQNKQAVVRHSTKLIDLYIKKHNGTLSEDELKELNLRREAILARGVIPPETQEEALAITQV